MNCPICDISLVISERKGIEIDYCPQCRGVWLDRGELDKIIDRSLDEQNERPQNYNPPRDERYSRSSDNYKKDEYYKQRRKKSLLGELFDFD